METPPLIPGRASAPHVFRRPLAVKILVLGAVVLALQIPLLLVRNTLDERRHYRDEAITGITQSWGGAQVLAGPMISVPYSVRARVENQTVVGDRVVKTEDMREVRGLAWFLPEELNVTAVIDPSERYRGIFRTPVYAAGVQMSGSFKPEPAALGLTQAVFDWPKATVVIGISDARGLRATPVLTFEGRETAFRPAAPRDGWPPLIEAPLAISESTGASGAFSCRISLQGAPRLAVAPVGATNRFEMNGAWADPSFDGGSLPVWREVSASGFSARWEVAHFGRGYPQQWADAGAGRSIDGQTFSLSAVGVTLATPVDPYRLVERSLKYALLFIVLLFSVFFGFDVLSTVRTHPLQYLLMGAALALFYLGFLALGEFLPPASAYAIAAGAATALLTGYAWSVLRTAARALTVGVVQAATFACLYFILQLQDYALLAGTGALFTLLSAAMWLTRHVDWYALNEPAKEGTSP